MRKYFALPLLLLWACTAEEEAAVNFTQYRATFLRIAADYYMRCGMLDRSREALLSQMPLLAVPPELQRVIDQEVAEGRVRLTTACLEPLKTASCDIIEANATIEACLTGGKQFVPQVPVGSLCRLAGECVGGYCDLGLSRKPCGMGACAPYLREGTECGPGKGLCDPDRASCWKGVCRLRSGPGGDCASDADCDPQSACRADAMGVRRCAARQKGLPRGAPCDGGQVPDGCSAGDRCLESEPDRGDFACRATRPLGGECLIDRECNSEQMNTDCVGADIAMKKKGTCQRQARLGEPCSLAGPVCQYTLYCARDNRCQPAGAVGAACEDGLGGQVCLSGLCAAPAMGRGACEAPRPDGAMCISRSDCASGVCDASRTCAPVCAPLRR